MLIIYYEVAVNIFLINIYGRLLISCNMYIEHYVFLLTEQFCTDRNTIHNTVKDYKIKG